eukprot:583950-Amphidinium_carterae.2
MAHTQSFECIGGAFGMIPGVDLKFPFSDHLCVHCHLAQVVTRVKDHISYRSAQSESLKHHQNKCKTTMKSTKVPFDTARFLFQHSTLRVTGHERGLSKFWVGAHGCCAGFLVALASSLFLYLGGNVCSNGIATNATCFLMPEVWPLGDWFARFLARRVLVRKPASLPAALEGMRR